MYVGWEFGGDAVDWLDFQGSVKPRCQNIRIKRHANNNLPLSVALFQSVLKYLQFLTIPC